MRSRCMQHDHDGRSKESTHGLTKEFVARRLWPAGLDMDPRESMPLFMLVASEGLALDAPELFSSNGKKVLPIWPVRREAYVKTRTAHRQQFPLTVSYALSVHKAQGMTLDRAVLNLSHKEHSPGLCYVAVSRARTLQGVLLQETVDLSRLQWIGGGPVHRMRQADYDRRRPQHLPPPSPSAHPSPDPFSDLEPMSSNPNPRRSDLPLDQLTPNSQSRESSLSSSLFDDDCEN